MHPSIICVLKLADQYKRCSYCLNLKTQKLFEYSQKNSKISFCINGYYNAFYVCQRALTYMVYPPLRAFIQYINGCLIHVIPVLLHIVVCQAQPAYMSTHRKILRSHFALMVIIMLFMLVRGHSLIWYTHLSGLSFRV